LLLLMVLHRVRVWGCSVGFLLEWSVHPSVGCQPPLIFIQFASSRLPPWALPAAKRLLVRSVGRGAASGGVWTLPHVCWGAFRRTLRRSPSPWWAHECSKHFDLTRGNSICCSGRPDLLVGQGGNLPVGPSWWTPWATHAEGMAFDGEEYTTTMTEGLGAYGDDGGAHRTGLDWLC